ncbi:MAG: hypothetical protein QOJ64_1000 [Acidobacteriota bacterium]|nr:hypothetical protein [Acidobacteriota bacterium]
MKSKINYMLFTVLIMVSALTGASQQPSRAMLLHTFAANQQTQTNTVQLVIEGKIINVHDGDTVTVLDKDNKKFHIRLQGIDAPEIKQKYGPESQQHLSGLVMGKQVTIVWTKVDKYRRTVGTIMLDGHDMNIEQVKAGLAWHFKKYAEEQEPQDRITYAKAEELARAGKLGLWQDPDPTPPGDYRVAVKVARWGPAPPEGTIIGNRSSKKYHRPECPGYRDMAEKNRVFFKSVDEAEAAGYKRAGNCPPESEVATARVTTVGSGSQNSPQVEKTGATQSAAASTQPTSSPQSGDVVGNKNSKVYHKPGCPGYNSVSEKNRVYFKTAEEAESAGYKRAGNCKSEDSATSTPATAPTDAKSSETVKTAATVVSPSPGTGSSAPTTGGVIGNKNSKVYHAPGCPGYKSVSEKNQVKFKTAAEAEAAGYKRAGNCKAGDSASSASTPATTTSSVVATPVASSTTGATASTPSTATAGEIIGNKNSKIYHRPDCPGYNNVSEKNQVKFKTVAEAEAAGYRAAKNCP